MRRVKQWAAIYPGTLQAAKSVKCVHTHDAQCIAQVRGMLNPFPRADAGREEIQDFQLPRPGC